MLKSIIEKSSPLQYILRLINAVCNARSFYSKAIMNWQNYYLLHIGLKKIFNAKFVNGEQLIFERFRDQQDFRRFYLKCIEIILSQERKLVILPNEVRIEYGDKTLAFYYDTKSAFDQTLNQLYEEFILEQYSQLHLQGKKVVDIGANIGDSSIFFSLNGASSVFAFEPFPYSFTLARKNLDLNSISNVLLFNQGCGKSGEIIISPDYESTGASRLEPAMDGVSIKIVSLRDIINAFQIENAVLKVDCEGCECELIAQAEDEDLIVFDEVIVEYHSGYESLVKRLKAADFVVHHTFPKYYGGSNGLGLIYAKRKDVLASIQQES